MLFLRGQFPLQLFNKTCKTSSLSALYHGFAHAEDDVPKYPPIFDPSPEGLLRRERQFFYDRVEEMPTVEQKLYAMTENTNYFDHIHTLRSCPTRYVGVPFHYYITRTHFIHGLPDSVQSLNVENDYDNIKTSLHDAIAKTFTNTWRDLKLNNMESFLTEVEGGSKLANDLLSHVCRNLSWKNNHLMTAAFDHRPALLSYWFHGGFELQKTQRRKHNTENICFQFKDQPCMSIRMSKGLPPIVPMNDPLCATGEVVDYNYHPRVSGSQFERHFIICDPSFWPGDERIFPLLQVYTRDPMKKILGRTKHIDVSEIEDAFGVMASFGWLNTLANYHGFTPYHDLTYPLVGQTILTNGQDWTFFVYQLNTISFHSDLDKKDRRNLCWTSKTMRLFDTVEDGKVKGLNDDVLKTLLKFVLHPPKELSTAMLTPYLGEDTRTEEEITVMRKQLRMWYRNLPHPRDYSHEVPLWQRIYKRHPDAPPCPWIRLQ